MKRIITTVVISLGFAALYAAETPSIPENGPFKQEGIASWYGAEFAGRPTASGEIFTPSQLTAAHPTLPFGTMLRITNRHNNKQVTVRVNDRGPFVSARIVDVSRAAAEALDMISTGTAPVLVESIGNAAAEPRPGIADLPPASTPAAGNTATSEIPVVWTGPAEIKPAIPLGGTDKRYRIQVGSYRLARNAAETFDKLKKAGLNPAYEKYEDFFRVVLAGVRAEEVRPTTEKLGAAGFRDALIREER
jgi:rare lipoprotein A